MKGSFLEQKNPKKKGYSATYYVSSKKDLSCFADVESPVKDKSSWRKSNLNVPNTSEETDLDARRLRRMRSRNSIENGSSSSMLQVCWKCKLHCKF